MFKRENISSNAVTGQTIVDGKEVGKRKWVGEAVADFTFKKQLILNCASEEEFEEKAFESLSGYARKHDLEIGPVHVDWSMPAEEYNGKG